MKTGKFPTIEFQEISRLNPAWSSWICFCEAIKRRGNLSKRTVKKYFEKLVEKEDYAVSEKRQLIDYLYSIATGD